MPAQLGRIAAALLLFTPFLISQDLAPEVLLLSRIKRHLREELARTPNYTCLETISRFHGNSANLSKPHRSLFSLDTVRLEIVYTDGKEWYGSPGARTLSIGDPVRFIGSGMIGNGLFAMTLHNAVVGGVFSHRGEEDVDGRHAVKYSYHIPQTLHPLHVSIAGGIGDTGEEGSIWVDPNTLDLLRMESQAAEIPPFLPLSESRSTIDYARVRIGDTSALLAQQADLYMREESGVEAFDRMEFTHCRAYQATSAISFDEKPLESEDATPPPAPAAGPAVPAFLRVTVVLATPIAGKDSVGAVIEGKIVDDVVSKKKVVVPRGSVVHGRIRRLERYPDRGAFIVGLEFTDVDGPAGSMPFYADFLRLDKNPRYEPALARRIFVVRNGAPHVADESITLPELPGVASFFVKDKNVSLPAGFRTYWRTRGPIH